MGAQPAPVTPPLSRGSDIEYKAFARNFGGGRAAVFSLIATCYYGTPGYTIFFQGGGGNKFELLETVPHGIVNQLVTYYLASWTGGQPLADPPSHVEITDASGTHRVKVEHWH
jgi:hypothetical protein